MIRISVPAHLRTLAKIPEHEVLVDVGDPPTHRPVLDALEAQYPALRGCVRDHTTKKRRAFIRFYACEEDLSNEGIDDPLPEEVSTGKEPYLIVGAMAGG